MLYLRYLLPLVVAVFSTACFDNGRPMTPPDPLTMAREYSGLWVPESAQLLKYDDSFYNEQQGRMYRQGLVELTMQLTATDFEALAEVAAARGYADLKWRRTMPPDSIGYQDAWPVPAGTPGLYQVTRGAGPNRINVVLREDTRTLELTIVHISGEFFSATASDTVIKRYACAAGACSLEPIGWPERQ